jgi:hypothetical protein
METSVNIFAGKDAALEAAQEELRALKEITSFDVSTGMLESDYKTHLEEYRKRVSWHHCLYVFLRLNKQCFFICITDQWHAAESFCRSLYSSLAS